MNSSRYLVSKCLMANLPMKLLVAHIRTTPMLRPDNRNEKHNDIEIVDIDVNNMFNEDEELAALFRKPCEPKQGGSIIADMQKMTIIEEQPKKGTVIPPPVKYEDK